MEPSASVAVIYFGVGFTIGGTTTMTVLTLLRPLLAGLSGGLMAALMFVPLVAALFFGARLAHVGLSRRLKLGPALRQAIGLGSRS